MREDVHKSEDEQAGYDLSTSLFIDSGVSFVAHSRNGY